MGESKSPDEEIRHRKIRSFVRREGRFTPAQRAAFESLWPQYGIDVIDSLWNLPAIFGRESDVYLELGFSALPSPKPSGGLFATSSVVTSSAVPE